MSKGRGQHRCVWLKSGIPRGGSRFSRRWPSCAATPRPWPPSSASNTGLIELRKAHVHAAVLLTADDAAVSDQAGIDSPDVTDYKHCLKYFRDASRIPTTDWITSPVSIPKSPRRSPATPNPKRGAGVPRLAGGRETGRHRPLHRNTEPSTTCWAKAAAMPACGSIRPTPYQDEGRPQGKSSKRSAMPIAPWRTCRPTPTCWR